MAQPALDNMVAATLTDTPFFADLAESVANDGDPDTAARWLWCNIFDKQSFISTYDRYRFAVESIGRTWPVVQLACEIFNYPRAPVARFVAERTPAAVNDQTEAVWGEWCKPVTCALVLADRAHDLVGLMSAGLKPNGSKDPYALRRTAKHFVQASMLIRGNPDD